MRDAQTLCELFQATATRYAEREALETRGGEVTLTSRDDGEQVRRLAAGFAALGVEPGEPLALMLRNRPEFHVADTAAFHLGAVRSRSTTAPAPSRSSSCSATRSRES